MDDLADALARRLAERSATVGVIGLGYVGLPLALAAVRAGFPVTGFDINPDRVARINAGEPVISHLDTAAMRAALATGRFRASTDMDGLGRCDAVLICVPTPLTPQREPDLSYIRATAADIARTLRPGQLVVLESTTWPGTTEEVLKPILEARGLTSGREIFLAFSPEREDPGNRTHTLATVPKVVGGDGSLARDLADALYGAIVARTVPVSSTATAEAVKLTENIFRAVNIALVNELKVVYDAMGIDVWEVIEAAASKPFGYMPFWPGPGLGGHCIPIDPFYLTWKAREFDVATRFIELAGEVNRGMPRYVVERLALALDRQRGRPLGGARILIVGVAYKRDLDDMRESPALKLIALLEERGAVIAYHDPLVPEIPPSRAHPGLTGRRSVALTAEALQACDAALVVTDHEGVDYALIAAEAPLVVDTRNALARHGLAGGHIVKA
ncbi:UDP-N-acetyl-D-glucosamine dehydrogenase [Methylobacterium gregans]|uniref:UDP-N-acetyl-D-glucosamine 6-dehydrogenase n=1 Tax=Methylobacterium gregans TaxID=374424 RepID=A0AA37MAA9_9HYPH|nr:nucleotide sugar dehydrogenase [Methylobacterium gregans]MDQ0522711.1 UDP-N-acetyl-D-glucosamine dehydrogenase [Methylobacterium gregans]GJD78585.1 UDP-N-acetyl-D-glucosamine 6-dehydrogenase [Methylobacterium gregans]GLS55293.1 UDP-N-acetyl-D-glucosamine dehydrogenase [Methylobacterium gregans]